MPHINSLNAKQFKFSQNQSTIALFNVIAIFKLHIFVVVVVVDDGCKARKMHFSLLIICKAVTLSWCALKCVQHRSTSIGSSSFQQLSFAFK